MTAAEARATVAEHNLGGAVAEIVETAPTPSETQRATLRATLREALVETTDRAEVADETR